MTSSSAATCLWDCSSPSGSSVPAYAALPIAVVLALSAKPDRLRAARAGARGVIAEPIDAVELRVRMNALLRLQVYHDEGKSHSPHLEQVLAAKTRPLLTPGKLDAAEWGIMTRDAVMGASILRCGSSRQPKAVHQGI